MSCRFLKSKGWDATLSVVGADGCRVNTGHYEGGIVHMEKLLGRPLHWFICLLHGVELPLRAFVRELDGGAKGPFSLKGPIGKTLGDELNELPIVPFKKVPNPDFPVVAEGDYELSKDQKYLLSMCHAVMEGYVPEDHANQTPGPLSMARWITLASRFLRKYVPAPNPSKTFEEIVSGIMHFYGSLSGPFPPVLRDQGTSSTWLKTLASLEIKSRKSSRRLCKEMHTLLIQRPSFSPCLKTAIKMSGLKLSIPS